jgi:hypothetical protein
MIDASDWNGSFDDLVAMRRRLKSSFGIPVRAEIKANYLVRNGGPFTKLNIAPWPTVPYISSTPKSDGTRRKA